MGKTPTHTQFLLCGVCRSENDKQLYTCLQSKQHSSSKWQI